MRFVTASLALMLGSFLSAPAVWAQVRSADPLISVESARRFGLDRSWFTQVRVDPNRGRIEHMRLHIHSKKAQTIYEVVTDSGLRFQFTDRQQDLYGEPIGVERAGELAQAKQKELAARGMQASVRSRTVPDMTLLVTTDQGMVHALDAETGKTRWTRAIGEPGYPTLEPAVSDEYIAVVNGLTAFVLSTEDGRVVMTKRAGGIPSAGAVILQNQVFIPMGTGVIEAYSLAEDATTWPEIHSAVGSVDSQPTVAGNRVAWATEYGDINVITAGSDGIQFRLRTEAELAGRMGFSPPDRIVAVTRNGYVYCFSIADGQILWQASTGEKTDEPAIVVGNQVYIVTKYAGVHVLDIETGLTLWVAPDVRQFVAATQDRVYGVGASGQLVMLDRATGAAVGRIPTVVTDKLFVNGQTDRIYVASASGLVQCLHETGASFPTIHVAYEEPAEEAPKEAPQTPEKKEPTPKAPVDPFGTGTPAAPAPKAEPKPPAGAPKPDENPFG